jgi:hypothetical protein
MVVEYNTDGEPILIRAKCSENSAAWNAVAHFQPLLKSVQEETIKYSSLGGSVPSSSVLSDCLLSSASF